MSTENFYFKDFTGDYYLTKDAEGISHLRVVQKMTAVFPNFNQNKGICLELPTTNQDGANVVLPYLSEYNISVTRNGEEEPIYSIDKYTNYYEVCTGTEEYVLGEQEYEFTYEYEKVITDFDSFQELYWDTNGNGWQQEFLSLTARVHLSEDIADEFTGEVDCYVGEYGESGQERCEISEIEDGVQFKTENLEAQENLTFDLEFEAGTFTVPDPIINYGLVVFLLIIGGICCLFLIRPLIKFFKSRERQKFYKNIFVAPQYQPDKRYTLPEMATVYMGKKKDARVGMILEMIVGKKVKLKKRDEKKWSLIVEKLKDLSEEEAKLLQVLNAGEKVAQGEEVKIRSYSFDAGIMKAEKDLEDLVGRRLKKDGLVEKSYQFKGFLEVKGVASAKAVTTGIWVTIFGVYGAIFLGPLGSYMIEDMTGKVLLKDSYLWILALEIILTIAARLFLKKRTTKFAERTEKGLEAARYMEGLRLYIKMAEAERLKVLQSVRGADVSAAGIVKLYEKLLPYAAVFGLEKSWMEELQKYCQVQKLPEPEYFRDGFTAMEISSAVRTSALVARSSSRGYSGGGGISGGGGFSSSSSGGSGGGSSGGGGGGGGGHGR